MPEETVASKKVYRKVKSLVKDLVMSNAGITLEEVVEKTGVTKFQCKTKLAKLVEKGEVVCVDGKYLPSVPQESVV